MSKLSRRSMLQKILIVLAEFESVCPQVTQSETYTNAKMSMRLEVQALCRKGVSGS